MVKLKIDQCEVLSARAHLLARVETYYRNYVSSMWQVARFRSQELLGDLWPADTREIEALYAEHIQLELGFCRVYDSSESEERRVQLDDSHTLLEGELVNHCSCLLRRREIHGKHTTSCGGLMLGCSDTGSYVGKLSGSLLPPTCPHKRSR